MRARTKIQNCRFETSIVFCKAAPNRSLSAKSRSHEDANSRVKKISSGSVRHKPSTPTEAIQGERVALCDGNWTRAVADLPREISAIPVLQ